MAFTVIANCLKLAQYIFQHIKTFFKKLSHSEEPEEDTIPDKDVMNSPQKSAFSDRRLE